MGYPFDSGRPGQRCRESAMPVAATACHHRSGAAWAVKPRAGVRGMGSPRPLSISHTQGQTMRHLTQMDNPSRRKCGHTESGHWRCLARTQDRRCGPATSRSEDAARRRPGAARMWSYLRRGALSAPHRATWPTKASRLNNCRSSWADGVVPLTVEPLTPEKPAPRNSSDPPRCRAA